MLHKSIRLGLTVLMLALASTVAAAAAQANPSAGDPHYTGCDQTGYVLLSRSMYDPANGAYMGTAYLKYSVACQTEWVTVNYASGYYPSPSVWNQNQSGTDLYTSDGAPYQGTVWTEQLPNMKYRAGCGGVQMYHTYNAYYPTQGRYIAWYYIGCA